MSDLKNQNLRSNFDINHFEGTYQSLCPKVG